MDVTFLYFDGCPNSEVARERLAEALDRLGLDPSVVTYATVETTEEAERLGFRGSPSILIDGTDPFAADESPVGLSCRIYRTNAGVEGAPTVDALTTALSS